jgi:hypothetical protein
VKLTLDSRIVRSNFFLGMAEIFPLTALEILLFCDFHTFKTAPLETVHGLIAVGPSGKSKTIEERKKNSKLLIVHNFFLLYFLASKQQQMKKKKSNKNFCFEGKKALFLPKFLFIDFSCIIDLSFLSFALSLSLEAHPAIFLAMKTNREFSII